MSAELEYLRTSLRVSLLETLAANLRHCEGEVSIFEAARVYLRRGDELPDEREYLAAAISGRREDRWGRPGEESVDFYDAKGYLEGLFDGLGLEASLTAGESFALVPGRTAEVRIDDRVVGVVGQVHPRVAAAFDIAQDAYLFEVILDELLPLVGGPRHYEPISRFPPVVQDIAVVLDEGVAAGRVQAIIEQARLVRRARLFDVYAGEQVGKGKKSLAFSVTYQSPDHTLTDEEVARAQRGIIGRLKQEVSATLRG
jgi:phenylalanyl-tRNA synthetase beta chain